MRITRFLRNASVSVSEISRHAGGLTGQRVAGREVVAIQDTSELALGGKRARAAGYGAVGKGGALGGLLLHPVLAVEVGGEALLGLAGLQIWNRASAAVAARRGRATRDKESWRWIEGMRQADEALAGASALTLVSDRESDVYELFARRPARAHLLVRACQNRKIKLAAPDEADELLFDFIDGQAEQGRFTRAIAAAPGRKARQAEFAVRFAPVSLCRPRHGADPTLPRTLDVTLLDVREAAAPADGSKPIHWRLLTTHAVADMAEAQRVVDLYRMRWRIEEFFRTMKTAGFDIEAADIAEPTAMINLVAAASVAAVTIQQLVQARDGTTDQRLADAFEPDERPILEAVSARLEGKTAKQRNPFPKGSLAFAAWVIARLGGWTGYYGKPGPKVMRIGLERFQAIKFGATLALPDV
jgi:hypothetical protein